MFRSPLALTCLALVGLFDVGCSSTSDCPPGSNRGSLFCHARDASSDDVAMDAFVDASPDATVDVPADAGPDVRPDVRPDAHPDVPVPVDVAMDVPADVPADVLTDTGRCRVNADCPSDQRCEVTSGQCVGCLTDPDCPTGSICEMNRCTTGCRFDTQCASGQHCDPTAHACVACVNNSQCPEGMVCTGNECVPGCTPDSACPSGTRCCGDACVDVQLNSANCGSCGNPCSGSGSIPGVCRAGVCGLDCPTGRGDCDGMVSTGCEVDLGSDPLHCAACDTPCPIPPHAAATCTGGACGFTCNDGFADCDGDASNGCEIDLNTDSAHCGACDNACAGTVVCDGTGHCGSCTAGMSCNTGDPCVLGSITCARSGAVCTPAGNADAGTSCGAGMVCNGAGACIACVTDAPCALPAQPCRVGQTVCSTGAPVCTDRGATPAGTTCGAGMVCDGAGACIACSEGASCALPGMPCRVGVIRCGTGAPVCTDAGGAPVGSPCGAGQVCNATNQCIACVSGMSCTAPGNLCRTGTLDCSTGVPTCAGLTPVSAGSSCGAGMVCDGAGMCVACSAGMACAPGGNVCAQGAIACSSGAPVCMMTGNTPAGTSCGTNRVCSGAGACVACANGAACSTGNACTTGTTQCATGAPVCATTGFAPAGTTCPTGICTATGTCCTPNVRLTGTGSCLNDSGTCGQSHYYTYYADGCGNTSSRLNTGCDAPGCCVGNQGSSCTYTQTYGPYCGAWGNCGDPAFYTDPSFCGNAGYSVNCWDTGPGSNCHTCSIGAQGTIQCDGSCS